MRGKKRLAALIASAALAAALAGCGSNEIDGTIPPSDADQLVAALDAVEAASRGGDCDAARARAQEFLEQVDLLPATSGTELKQALRDAGNNLERLVQAPCAAGATGATGPQSSVSPRPRGSGATTTPEPPSTAPSTAPSTTPSGSRPARPGGGNQDAGSNRNPGGNAQGGGNTGGGNTGGGSTGGGNTGGGNTGGGSTGGTGVEVGGGN